MIACEAQPPSSYGKLIKPATHTHHTNRRHSGLRYRCTLIPFMHINTHRILWQSFRLSTDRTIIHLNGGSTTGVMWMCVSVCVKLPDLGESYSACWSSSVTQSSQSLAGAAAMDLSADTLILLIGLIGFQRACRETEPDTDQITAKTPVRTYHRQWEEEGGNKWTLKDELKSGGAEGEGGRIILFITRAERSKIEVLRHWQKVKKKEDVPV